MLTEKQDWWLTAGFALALWEISTAPTFRRRRSFFELFPTSFVLLLYVYASSIAFLAGVQADACLRRGSGP